MITGIHALVYTKDPDGARKFFGETLGFRSVDAGEGWLIFALPPAELGVHPSDGDSHHQLYLMCDDVEKTIADLKKKGVKFSAPVTDEGYGLFTEIKLPGGGKLGLYEPRHKTAIE
jgi:predicted enzyme related to lactoylglutathione lyase